jgi:ribonuclease P protein component
VLIVLENAEDQTRIAVSAGRSVGNAVQRNRSKRLIREAVRPLIPQIKPGWDVLLLARQRLAGATLWEIQPALREVFRRAHLLIDRNGE